jgi:hypothetical protein
MIKKAQSGLKLKNKVKSVVKTKMQVPADFEPKSKFPRTPGGGDNYDETIKRERDLKAKGMMKKGGAVKKAEKGTKFGMLSVKAKVDNNPGITAADRIAGAKGLAKKGASMKKCKYGCK